MENVSEYDRVKLVFAYWIRTLLAMNQNISAEDCMDLVWKYFFYLHFDWDPQRKHRGFAISNDGLHVTDGGSGLYKSLCAKYILSSANASLVRWEVTLLQKGDDGSAFLCLGYIDQKDIRHFDRGFKYDR